MRDEGHADLEGDEVDDDELHVVTGLLGEEGAQYFEEVLAVVQLGVECLGAWLHVEGRADAAVQRFHVAVFPVQFGVVDKVVAAEVEALADV